MIIFAALAAVLAITAVAFLALPLLRPKGARVASAAWAALACAAILVIGSAVLYAALSRGAPGGSPAPNSPESMVESLVQQLNRHPGDLQGWLMLGRSYVALQEYSRAVDAYQRADRVAGGRNAQALVGEAEALTLVNGSQITARAAELIERSLVLDPADPHALFYGGVVALQRGDLALARARFTKLLALDPPANMKAVIEAHIAAIDRRLPSAVAAAAVQSATPDPLPRAAAPLVRVEVELAPALEARIARTGALYVFVRDPAEGGPPLAVKRLQSRFPQTVELTAADAMIPGRGITDGEQVEVVARISPSGNPMDESGDLTGRVHYRIGQDGLVTILIDRVTP
jgi:cytochrome c-type biogenesis protein CcmH